MKLNFKPGRILSNLWRTFTVPALLCAAICVLGIVQAFMYAPVTAPAYERISLILSACLMGLVLATAVCTLVKKPALSRGLSLAAAGLGAGVYWLTHEDFMVSGGLMIAGVALCFRGACGRKAPAVRLNQILGWFFTSLGLAIVVYIALQIITSAVTGLFFDDLNYRVSGAVSTTVAYLSFFLFAPWMFLGGLPDEDTPLDKRAGFHKFNARVLLPLSLLLMAVLLVYVGKIVVTWTMPVGTMNGFALAALTLFAFFHLTLTGEENRISAWFRKWAAWLMVPVLIAQQVGVWIRVSAYGLTESRVLGIVLTVLCAAVVVTALLRKRANWFFPVAAVMAVVFIGSPFNADNIAMNDQVGRLEAALTRNNMLAEDGSIVANPDADKDDQAIIWSAMDYVLNHYTPDEPIAVQLYGQLCEISEVDFDPETASVIYSYNRSAKRELLGFFEPDYVSTSKYWTFTGTAKSNEVDVADFDYAQWIYVSEYVYIESDAAAPWEPDIPDEEGSACTFDIPAVIDALNAAESDTFVFPDAELTFLIDGEHVDLRPMLASLVENTDPTTPYDREFEIAEDRFILPSGRVLHVNQLYLYRYDYSDSASMNVSLTGWLLTPEATE